MGSFSVGRGVEPLFRSLTAGGGRMPSRRSIVHRADLRSGAVTMQEWMVISGTSHQGDAITRRFASLRRRAGGLLPKLVVQFANPVDCDGDCVDRLLHRSDADRRAAADQVAW